jgi:hypothetical protein
MRLDAPPNVSDSAVQRVVDAARQPLLGIPSLLLAFGLPPSVSPDAASNEILG